jgi:S-sulfo-L-cysteine synthase (O-acetyl-L-serine-dependent)
LSSLETPAFHVVPAFIAVSKLAADEAAQDNKKPAMPIDMRVLRGFKSDSTNWCPGPESNRHAFRRGILSPLRLPISPPGLEEAKSEIMAQCRMNFLTIEDAIGKTPLIALQRIAAVENAARGNVMLGKLEGNNPAGSVKDRPALAMIKRAEERGEIKPGDTLIEATSGNTGIALAMAAAIKGYRMVLIMPEDLSIERAQTMKAFGAELILTPKSGGMEHSRDLAHQMQEEGKGTVLDQFANMDNPRVHYETTGPEIWTDTAGKVTHFVSAMGTTGTITGVSRYLKEKNPAIKIIGAQPSEGSRIPGIRKWPQAYMPKIYDPSHVDELVLVSQHDAEDMCRRMAREEGIFAGISAAGACWVAQEIAKTVTDAVIVFIVCDRGDRYLSTGVFPA